MELQRYSQGAGSGTETQPERSGEVFLEEGASERTIKGCIKGMQKEGKISGIKVRTRGAC